MANEIRLNVYCDEIHKSYLDYDRSYWMYIGILFVPLNIKSQLLNELLNCRCIQHDSWVWDKHDCEFQCGYHDYNNGEIHYNKIHSNAKFRIAYRLINDFVIEKNNIGDLKLIYFNILGLNLTKMNLESFGSSEGRDLRIYNRFFRTVLKGGINFFFSEYDNRTIENIYHDRGPQEQNEYFPWHSPYKLNIEESGIQVENTNIRFIDSNHNKCSNLEDKEEAQFIQFIDLILGCIYCCLHNPAERIEKKRIGQSMIPLLDRLMNNPNNPNSRFHYYRRQKVSFFPRNGIDFNDQGQQIDLDGNIIESNIQNNFYNERRILLESLNQSTLDEYI